MCSALSFDARCRLIRGAQRLNLRPRTRFKFMLFMPKRSSRTIAIAGLLNLFLLAASAGEPGPWRALFDGEDTSAWRGFCQKEFPKDKWVVEDGCLHLLKNPEQGGELVTVETFDNFEFEWEWKIAAKGNNGIKYFVTESRPETPGHEYQMIDDTVVKRPKQQTAAFYDVLATQVPTTVKPPGQWNRSRLVVQGPHVEHWLNGGKVLSYELGSAEVKAALAGSKFKDVADFGKKIKGHILLTNHHTETWFRNLRLRDLPAK